MEIWNLHQNPIGGEGKVVEIDEAVWRRRNYKRGRRKEQIWIFGGVERCMRQHDRGLVGNIAQSFPQYGVRKTLIADHLAMFLVKTSLKFKFQDISPSIVKCKAVEKPAEDLDEEEVKDEDSEIPQIEDIMGGDETDDYSSGLWT
ncbi:uncharacterized protein MONOS_15343 [Monocercomonoides exilis]|uniref:uncharacterized protein n=1 Tax=Monocercomonoides exilis TaxID=2049356 RepID=UPI00355972CA|nr:hypothetical protein MONOS_15343 [Monocercomonoides exilis]|eukprot:MONOS_15343.1-p1 / transcript=MONOS_15343.1 / gene=MONOS_15343 / organism=Monocercomonoides_exilis_PA203 / gene_product=unspecified product / transcript_product=unspecified product / location=Mono_scaffold01203:7025-7664(+) / protein_length=145 / sequence_SO=supercontig / SO=protein_coding / is_pseudo=false